MFIRAVVQSLKCRRQFSLSTIKKNTDFIEELDTPNEEYDRIANKCFLYTEQRCFIIHPYIKWGPKKKLDTSTENELCEAVSLINTLHGWQIQGQTIIPVENFDKKAIFGTGTLDKLKQQIRNNKSISSVFINIGTLRNRQILELESIFKVTILDRYKIVMHILRQHATTKHAKLQVALAEIPYLRSRLKFIDLGSSDWKVRDKMLQERELKLKIALKKLRGQRELLRNKRKELNFPVVAVVGYTNVGKTSLIKTLTGDKNLQPKNQLFATLDVTMHAGFLPSKLEVLYVDTVGFITDIPTNLIECFIATLEDAMLAGLVAAGIGDMSKPADQISLSQSSSLAATGFIWARYSLVIIPKNYGLFSVNLFVGLTQVIQAYRAYSYQKLQEKLGKENADVSIITTL